MDKVALGRQGEIFVLRRLMDEGWKLASLPSNMEVSDWEFEMGDRKIRIQVKTSKRMIFSLKNNKNFDYLIFTDLQDIYVIPKEMLNNSDKMSNTLRKFKNRYELLKVTGVKLLSAINDCGVRFYELNRTEPFFAGSFRLNRCLNA